MRVRLNGLRHFLPRTGRGTGVLALAAALLGVASACSDAGPAAPSDSAVTVSPSSATVDVGATVQLKAAVTGPSGEPLSGRTVSWSSLDGSTAEVGADGIVRGLAAGAARIVAASGGKADTAQVTVIQSPTPPGGPTMVAVGDIAWCGGTNDEKVAAVADSLLRNGASALALLGDNAYESGSTPDYQNCYDPAWGRFKGVTYPAPGNHEYLTSRGAPYYAYFGARAGDPSKGYYSYDLGDWHVVVLNSNYDYVSTDAGSAQLQWLSADLAAHHPACTLAYWHHPRFSSGSEHGNEPRVQPFWDALYAAGVDVVLNGHDHDYERFAPQNAAGARDDAQGITEFVVGTGGRSLYTLGTRRPNSLVFNPSSYGVLKLTLHANAYDFEFVPAAGSHAIESGSASCH